MTSYLGSLTTHYNSIKRLLPSHLSPDADTTISDPSDSHVSRVLRAYYSEKSRPFPPWLGADPNAPARPQLNCVSSQSRHSGAAPARSLTESSVSSLSGRRGERGGGLGDLFGDPPATQAQQQQDEPLSLRSRRGAFKATTQQIAAPSATSTVQPTVRPMPMPSQRYGSYQSRSSDSGSTYSQPVVREQTAQERLRARLGSSRFVSPVATPSPSANFDSRSQGRDKSGFNPYESGGGGYNPYESGNGGGAGFNPYENGPKSSYNTSSSSRNQNPYASSNSPWTTGDDSGDLGSGTGRRGIGLPENPRSRR